MFWTKTEAGEHNTNLLQVHKTCARLDHLRALSSFNRFGQPTSYLPPAKKNMRPHRPRSASLQPRNRNLFLIGSDFGGIYIPGKGHLGDQHFKKPQPGKTKQNPGKINQSNYFVCSINQSNSLTVSEPAHNAKKKCCFRPSWSLACSWSQPLATT